MRKEKQNTGRHIGKQKNKVVDPYSSKSIIILNINEINTEEVEIVRIN